MANSKACRPRRPRKRRRERLDTDERRARLIASGQAIFADHSYDEISIDGLAKAAGVSRGLFYHYFGTKRGFYVACLRASAKELVEQTIAAAEAAGDEPPNRLRAGLDAYLGFVAERGPAYAALFRGGIGSDPEVVSVIDDARNAFLDRLTADADAIDFGSLPLVKLALRGWIGFVEVTSLDWVGTQDVQLADLRDYLMDLLAAAVDGAIRRSNL